MKQKLNQLFAKILDIDINDENDMEMKISQPIDSLNLMNIIASIEEEFQVNFTHDEIVNMTDYESIMNNLERKIDHEN